MEKLARMDWSLLYTSMAHVKSCAENLLFLTGFLGGIPRIVRMLSLSSGGSLAYLKPWEIFLGRIKDTGSFAEVFEKVPPRNIKKRESLCGFVGRRADAVAVAIEGLIMVPHRANLLPLGRFAGALGGLNIVKDSCALLAIGCGFHVAGGKIRRNVAKIEKCDGRLKVLKKLEILVQKTSWTNQELWEIDCLKRIYRRRQEPQLLQRLEKKWSAQVWAQRFDPQDVSRLRDVVSQKIVSRQIKRLRSTKRIEFAKADRRHSVSIFILIALGLVAQVGLFTTSSLLFLGQWIASLSTGILGFGKIVADLQYKSVVRNSRSC